MSLPDTARPLPAAVAAAADGAPVTLAGRLASVHRKSTAQGRRWATATVRGGDGSAVGLVLFPAVYSTTATADLQPGLPVTVRGRVNRADPAPTVYVAALEVTR